MKLINNQDSTLLGELKPLLSATSEVFISTNYLTIPAIFELLAELHQVKFVKLILDNEVSSDKRFSYDFLEFSLYDDLKSAWKAKEVYDVIEAKFEIRPGNVGGQKFILIKNEDTVHFFSTFAQDLTTVTLGILPSKTPMILTYLEDQGAIYLQLFNQYWSSTNKDLKSYVLDKIKRAFTENSPEYLYKYTLYSIFKKSITKEQNEERINQIGFKQTVIWDMLFNFQKDAVLGAIDKIDTYGGCIIADSVGLGKTFEALAVIKYYQMRNDRILVLAPKKLRQNWLMYSQNIVHNILAKDRLDFDVLNHTDLSRTSGNSGNIDLEKINWGNYDLVVIDESHNFRNDNPRRNMVTRYQKLMNDIIKAGVKTKVLMLSATPLNTRMNDIKNQIAFITEQKDDALASFGIKSINRTLTNAQTKFNNWRTISSSNTGNRDSLISSLDGSYFKLLDLLTIARSRKHIEKYYDVNDIGKFPVRLPPINIYSDFDREGSLTAIDKINDTLNTLNLGFYSPLSYVRSDKKASYETKYDLTTSNGNVFKQIERESSLIHLMRVNLLKRLESSVHSFGLTLDVLLRQIESMLTKIEKVSSTDFYENGLDINQIDTTVDDLLEDHLTGGKIRVLLQDMDLVRCKDDLLEDKKYLENLRQQTTIISPERDAKLDELKKIIRNKVTQPLNPGNTKIVVFSAFSDTAVYLYENIAAWALANLHVYSAQITGGNNGNKTNMEDCKAEFDTILVNFSPISKKRELVNPEIKKEISVLICTDCISEGQNLQDCDYLVNYDIHWNPVRIIQRFGRIDRIGSKNDKVQLVNFFPNLALDSYIDLIQRVKSRMQILDVSATGDDNIIDVENGGYSDLEYRKRQLHQLQNKVLDLEDMEGGISITDLTFNDFKIDAERLSPPERTRFDSAPKCLYALVKNNTDEPLSGVIFCLKDTANSDNDFTIKSAIYPYHLCFIDQNDAVFVPANNPKRSLDYYKKLCMGQSEALLPLVQSFAKETQKGKKMAAYVNLLQLAQAHIRGVEDEVGLNTLALPGGTKLNRASGAVLPFEIISFLVIKHDK